METEDGQDAAEAQTGEDRTPAKPKKDHSDEGLMPYPVARKVLRRLDLFEGMKKVGVHQLILYIHCSQVLASETFMENVKRAPRLDMPRWWQPDHDVMLLNGVMQWGVGGDGVCY